MVKAFFQPNFDSLGFAYQHGNGLIKDYKQAIYWYKKSAEQGNASSKNNLTAIKAEIAKP